MKSKLVCALMVFLAGALPGMASNCAAPVVVHHQKHVQAEIVYPAQVVKEVTVVVPVYGIVPLIQYPAAYYAPPALAAPLQEESRLDRIERLLLQMAEGKTMPLQAAKSVSCQSCHDGSKQDAPKMDFSALTPAQKALSAERVLDGSMPPKSRLSKEEKRQVLAEVVK